MQDSNKRLLYSLVSRGEQVLAEHIVNRMTGNFTTVARTLLGKIPPEDGKASYAYDRYLFHYIVKGGLTYLCMADETMGRTVPYDFLREVCSRFEAAFGDRAKTAIAYAFNADFEGELARQMEAFNEKARNVKIAKVQKELSDVKDIMVQNIDKVLARGEKIELLVDKSSNLDRQALVFKKEATKMKRAFWWKSVRAWLLIFFAALIILYVILAFSCGGLSIPKCR